MLVVALGTTFGVEEARAQDWNRTEVFGSIGLATCSAGDLYIAPGWTSLGVGCSRHGPACGQNRIQPDDRFVSGYDFGHPTDRHRRSRIPVYGSRRHKRDEDPHRKRSVRFFGRPHPAVRRCGNGAIFAGGVWSWSGGTARPRQEYEFQATSLTFRLRRGPIFRCRVASVTPEVGIQNASLTIPASPTADEVLVARIVTRERSVALGYGW